MAQHDPELLEQILTWIGVTNQLTTTRLNQLLFDLSLPFPQYVMLSYFSRDPEQGLTVTQLSAAFQANQPAISKTAQHLLAKGYLKVKVSDEDKRVKYNFITPSGLATYRKANAIFEEDAQRIFEDWTFDEIDELHEYILRLKNWLDEHRDMLTKERSRR